VVRADVKGMHEKRLVFDHYREKVESMRESKRKAQAKGQVSSKAEEERLARNEEKLVESETGLQQCVGRGPPSLRPSGCPPTPTPHPHPPPPRRRSGPHARPRPRAAGGVRGAPQLSAAAVLPDAAAGVQGLHPLRARAGRPRGLPDGAHQGPARAQ